MERLLKGIERPKSNAGVGNNLQADFCGIENKIFYQVVTLPLDF
jgi:hypothetical protein